MSLLPASLPVPLLCIDPSSTKIGWALFTANQAGPIYIASNFYQIPETAKPEERVIMVGPAVNYIIQNCHTLGYPPVAVLIEIPNFIAKKATGNIVTYHRAVGVAEYAIWLSRLPILRITASHEQLIGRKKRYIERFKIAMGRDAGSDDESDAFCLCLDYLMDLILASRQPPNTPPF